MASASRSVQEHRVLEGFDDSTAARVRIDADGRAEIHCAAAEVGQGVSDVILQVAREELGTDDVVLAPTRPPWCSRPARPRLLGSPGWCRRGPRRLPRCARRPRRTGAAARSTSSAYRHPRTWPLDPETGQTTGVRSHVAFAVSAMKVVAEVDEELGLTRIVWIGTAQDVGRGEPARRAGPDRGRHGGSGSR